MNMESGSRAEGESNPAILHDDGTWSWLKGGYYLGGMECAEFLPASAFLAAQQSLQEIEGYLSAEMGDGQLPPRVKDRIDKAYAAARVALGKNPSP